MKKLILALVLCLLPFNLAAQQTTIGGGGGGWDGTADAVYSVTPFNIRANTLDGADNFTFNICAGGACGTTRGAGIQLKGDDVGGAGAGGGITYESGTGLTGFHYFYTGGTLDLTLGSSDVDDVDFILGVNSTTAPDFIFRAQTSNADDDALIRIASGGAVGTDRGAQIEAYGNERTGGNGGLLRLMVGEVANSMLEIYAGGRKWHVPYNATATIGDLVYGPAGTANFVATIRHGRADTEDNGTLQMTGGGSSTLSGTRGAYIQAEGADVGGAGAGGDLVLAAASTGGFIKFTGGLDPKGSTSNLKNVACEEITIPVGSGLDPVVTSGTNLCASGIIVSVGARVTQAPGGGATTLDVGCTGSGNLDQFIDGISTALSTTGAYPTNGDGTNTVWVQKTATTLTLSTDADVTVSDMKARVCVYYMDTTAPTS